MEALLPGYGIRVDSPVLRSSPFLLVTLAFYGHRRDYHLSLQEERKLNLWSLLANAEGRCSRGSSETNLDHDLAILREGGARLCSKVHADLHCRK